MKGYWIVTIMQKRKANYAENTWYTEEWNLHCANLIDVQGIIDNLNAVWPSGYPPMEVRIKWHEVEPNADTIPDTDFMEGGEQ